VVLDKKINRIPVKISKDKNGFVAYIDGDRLDAYKTQREAEKWQRVC
jgi:predicted transcriptional regulator